MQQHSASWLATAWQFWSADTLWCIGDDRAARQRAIKGITQAAHTMDNVGVAGAFCRWAAVMATTWRPDEAVTHQFIHQVRNIQWRDTLDQTEIALAASSPFGRSIVSADDIRLAQRHISLNLPAPTKAQLRHLGLSFPSADQEQQGRPLVNYPITARHPDDRLTAGPETVSSGK